MHIFREWGRAGTGTWRRGSILGLIFAVGQVLQTIGLQYTDASISGFITGTYVVMTPVILAVFFGRHLGAAVWLSVGLATAGLGVLSLQGWAFGLGETLTLVAAACYATHIVLLSFWARTDDPTTLGYIQILVLGAGLLLVALPGGLQFPGSPTAWASLVYMALVAGLLATIAQAWAQSRLPATTVAITLTTEPVFAAVFAVWFGGEAATGRLFLGGALVVAAMAMVELRSPAEQGES